MLTPTKPDPQQLDFRAKLKVLHEISDALVEVNSFDDFCRYTVEWGRDRLAFDRLGLWLLEPANPQCAIGSFGTDEMGQTRDERDRRIEAVLEDGPIRTMLQSRAIQSHRHNMPLYDDKSQVVGYGEAAMTILWDGERALGWLAIDNLLHQEHLSEDQLDLLALYGATISQLVARKRVEAALRQYQSRLKALNEVTIELSKTQSSEELCRRAVELGQKRLGFDRLGLWIYDDEDPTMAVGTFGIDEQGNIRDERMHRTSWGFGGMESILDNRVLVTAQPDAPLYSDRSEVIGHRWNAVAMVTDGERSVGWLSTDNLLSGQPWTASHLELLAQFAATLGPLAAVRRAEEALVDERNLLRTIIDALPDFIFVKNTAGQFVLVNQASWEDTPGASVENDLIGKTDFDILPRELAQRYWVDDQAVMSTGAPLINSEEAGRGTSVSYITTKVPLKDAHGNITGLVGVARDISDLKRAERQALELTVERERVKMMRQFIANISHDLRTPLTIISSSLELLKHIIGHERQQGHLRTISEQTALLTRFIEEILTSARLENASFLLHNAINLNELVLRVRQQLAPLAEEKQVTICIAQPATLPDIRGDEVELMRMLANLIQNAIYYTPKSGQVTLKTYNQEDMVIVEISDSGIGISETDLPQIFHHFFRANQARSIDRGGAGLGLAIAKRIVEVHNGAIEVNSVVGQGTTFRILLPSSERKPN
jgi:PAS domain S-box-containing protein